MGKCLNNSFWLETPVAEKLYYEHVSKLPVLDFLSQNLESNDRITNITEFWLCGDNYKHNLMRSCGVDERFITGNSSDFEKFKEFCRIMPLLVGNSIYYICHFELCNFFDCDLVINSDNCDDIWSITAEKFAADGFCIKDLILKSNVTLLCIPDDPLDDLFCYDRRNESEYSTLALPTFYPERIMDIEKENFSDYIKKLGIKTGIRISNFESLCLAYQCILDQFDQFVCKVAYSVADSIIPFVKPDPYHTNIIFKKAIGDISAKLENEDIAMWRTQMMRFLGTEYKKRGWSLRVDLSNSITNNKYSKNSVFDIVSLIEYLHNNNALPKIALYSYDTLITADILREVYNKTRGNPPQMSYGLLCSFDSCFEDVEMQIKRTAARLPLGSCLGVSYCTASNVHYINCDMFRRALCNVVAKWLKEGMCSDYETAAILVKRVSYYNAVDFFKLHTINEEI